MHVVLLDIRRDVCYQHYPHPTDSIAIETIRSHIEIEAIRCRICICIRLQIQRMCNGVLPIATKLVALQQCLLVIERKRDAHACANVAGL
jgi:hypothetical protein